MTFQHKYFTIVLLLLLIITIIPLTSWCASFNCSKAASRSEIMICSNSEISRADEKLAKAYKSALAATQDKPALKQEQRDWLKKVASAPSEKSLLQLYNERIIVGSVCTLSKNG